MSVKTFHTYLTDAEATDGWPVFQAGPDAVRIKRVTHQVAGSSTPSLDFNLEKRDEDDPHTAGTDIWSADKTADATSSTETSFDAPDLAARQMLWFAASSVSGTVDAVHISGEYDLVPIEITVPAPADLYLYGIGATVLVEDVFHGVMCEIPGEVWIYQGGENPGALVGLVSQEFTAYRPRRTGRRTAGRADVRRRPPHGRW
jgi:hypothetical protein